MKASASVASGSISIGIENHRLLRARVVNHRGVFEFFGSCWYPFGMNQPLHRAISLTILILLPLARFAAAAPMPNDGKPHTFSLHDEKFWIDDQPIRIMAGEIHPSRIPAQFWDDRIKKAAAMGLNTVSVYIFWSQLEPQEGKFDFTGNNDVRHFIQLCRDNGMWVFLRPGPYVCAETEFGGFPAWLLKHKDMQVRTDDPQFMNYQKQYLQKLHDQVGDLQITHGGPILDVQMENETGAIDEYMNDLKEIFVGVGFDTQLSTCDHHVDIWHQINGMPNVLRGYNGLVPTDNNHPEMAEAARQAGDELADQKLADLETVNKYMGYPMYTPESYTAWFSCWGGKLAKKTVEQQVRDAQWLVDHPQVSFCYYLFDGGTNFGFSNGANRFLFVTTTYDYDAPINELGQVTPKYKALRQLFIDTLGANPPAIPPDPKVISIPPFTLTAGATLLQALPLPIDADMPDVESMEDIGQNYGLIDYRKHLDNGVSGMLDIGPTGNASYPRAMDYAWVMIDGKVVGESNDSNPASKYQFKLNQPGPCTLDILVYNLGRNSVGIIQAISRKGLIADPSLDGQDLKGWDIFSLPMDPPDTSTSTSNIVGDGPIFYTGTFHLNEVGETYLDMSNFSFGAVWVNGHNLGRFWDVGESRALYLPSVWQNAGDNQITVLEMGNRPQSPSIQGVTQMVTTPPKAFEPYHGN
jgi:beta-galactosidase